MTDADFGDLRKQCVMSVYSCLDNVTKYLVDTEQSSELDKLKSYIENYCMLEAQQKVANEALDRAKRETDPSNIDKFRDKFTDHLSSLASTKCDVAKHPYMQDFKQRVAQAQRQIKERDNLDESDLAITGSQDQYVDPITKKVIENPVKNNICGHVYEQESIMRLIDIKKRVRCPVSGCGNKEPITTKHLVLDEELKFRMALTQHSTIIQERSVMDLDQSL